MKRLSFGIAMIFLLCFLAGCQPASASGRENTSGTVGAVLRFPTDNSVNGYRREGKNPYTIESEEEKGTASTESEEAGPPLYYANVKSGTFHKSTCGAARRITNERLYVTENRDELVQDGYDPCEICEP